jgi:hypothetical protein
MDKKPRTGLWSSHNLNEESLTDTQIDFLMSCFEQNLEHARHVENERLTFNSIYMALVGGVLAFVYSTEVKYVMFSVGVTVLLIITGFIAMLLTKRWDHTFDRHIEYAKGCYRLVHQSLFPDDLDDEDENNEDAAASEWINGVNGLPAYAFRPKNPESKHDSGPVAAMANYVYSTFRTRRLFKYFYWLIQLVLIASMVYFLTQM